MTPRAYTYAKEIGARHGVSVEAMFAEKPRRVARPVTNARWELWKRLTDEGLNANEIERETGHHRASILYALRKMAGTLRVRKRTWPPRQKPRPVDEEGLRIVQANIAAMHAKHQRDLASRY